MVDETGEVVDVFRVRTTEGRLFDLYLDRTGNRAHWKWYLSREIASAPPPE